MKTLTTQTLIRLGAALVIAALSFFLLGSITTTPEFHEDSILSLQERQEDVLGLAAASAAASAAVAVVPGDATTPIANTLAELSAGFMVVLSAIFLEKYLLIIGCFAAFKVLIPVACLVFAGGQLARRAGWQTLALKLGVFGLILALAVPVSVRASDYIHDTYDISIQATLDAAQETTQAVEDGVSGSQTQEEDGFWSSLVGSVTSGITQATDAVTDTVGSLITRFVEALAMTLVTCCAIPLLVLLLFWWSFKLLFTQQAPALLPRPAKGKAATPSAPEQEEALV